MGVSGNPNGRPKGSKNKAGEQLRASISGFLEQHFEQLVDDFALLKPKDRIRVFTELLQYCVPKLQAVSNSLEFEKMTDEELDYIISQLVQTNGQE